ncbi:MAG TPA: biosynthetic-type acetolactate synthase large subunit [Solirubrobacterales bacterium]
MSITGIPERPADAPTPPRVERPQGADVVLRVLEEEGAEVCFGIPGGAILPLYDAIARGTTIRHVLAQHEQGAGHMAEGYARADGRPGVVLATSGPGATNLVTPIADAAMDSTPLVCITGQVRSNLIGTDAFQECDIVAVTAPLVKGSWFVAAVEELADAVRDAYRLAAEGRPGPVLVDIPRDVQEARVRYAAPPGRGARRRRAAAPPTAAGAAITAAARAIEAAERPVLYVGGGVIAAGATEELRAFAEAARLPVVSTLMAKGAFPESHPLAFGSPGMHGGRWANLALQRADVIVAVGARFDDRVTGNAAEFAAAARIVHFDLDPREVGKIKAVEFPVVGELRDALGRTRRALRRPPATAAWLGQIGDWHRRHPLSYDESPPALKPQTVVRRLGEWLGDGTDAVWTTGVGQHQMWAMQHLACERPRSFITSGGHGTMGFGVPAAIGARAARPDAAVVCIDGDASFLMTCQELATAVAEELPILVVVLNNSGMGMVVQQQDMFFDGRRSQSHAPSGTDLALIARGFGAQAFTVKDEEWLRVTVAEALRSGRPTVLDVHVDPDERVYPVAKPGAATAEMIEHEVT